MTETLIEEIAEDIKNTAGTNLIALYNYGSALTEHYCDFSDLDFLIILDEAEPDHLYNLKQVIQKYADQGTIVDINVQTKDEMPPVRAEAFWHNNRGMYVQREISLYGKLLHGEEQFSEHESMDQEAIMLECVRVINSLVYQTRKALINRELAEAEKYRILKFSIYAAVYALAAKGIFPETRTQIFDRFKKEFSALEDPSAFLHLKTTKGGKTADKDILKAYKFLKEVDGAVYKIYQEGKRK